MPKKTDYLKTRLAICYKKYNKSTRPIQVYPHSYSDEPNEKWGVGRVNYRFPRSLLVTGTGRCGTHYVSQLFKKAGLDLPHEMVGDLGTSSHAFIVDSDWYIAQAFPPYGVVHVGERRSDYEFHHVVHLVREPLKTIASMASIFRQLDYDFFTDNGVLPKQIPDDKLHRAMLLYYHVNRYIKEHERNVTLVRVENIKDAWPTLLKLAGAQPCPMPEIEPTNTRSKYRRNSYTITWSDMDAVDSELSTRIFALATSYGY